MRKRIPYLHIVLFIATFLSTLFAGTILEGINPLEEPHRIWEGWPFSLSLMLILLSHELSHYFASRHYRIAATLPYFIPGPPLPPMPGTFGAIIKMKSPIASRRALIDVGASGPVVGFIFSLVATVVGLTFSEILPMPDGEQMGFILGDSLLFSSLCRLIVGVPLEGYYIDLHPVAFAGWFGFFVTMLNLLPIGQLDGGHITYALLGPRHRKVSIILTVGLGVLAYFTWPGWAVWAFLMVIVGVNHPPVLYWEVPLDPWRRRLGWFALFILVITFIPQPFSI